MADKVEQEVFSPEAEARAERVKNLRKALGRLSRTKFANRLKIPRGTLQNWEEMRFGGLSEKGAKRLVKGLQSIGIGCTVAWLMHGVGDAPAILNSINNLLYDSQELTHEEDIIAQELKIFHQLNPNAVDTIITDESMLPCFKLGDHVAGRRYFEKDIEEAIGQPCIVQTTDPNTGTLVRLVEPGNRKGLYTLTCTNSSTQGEKATLHDIKLFSAAPILWIRRKGTVFKF